MGIKKNLTPIYSKNEFGTRILTGHKLNGVFIPLGKPLVIKSNAKPIHKEVIKENPSRFNFTKKKK